MIFDSYQLDVPIVKKGGLIRPSLDSRGSVEMAEIRFDLWGKGDLGSGFVKRTWKNIVHI